MGKSHALRPLCAEKVWHAGCCALWWMLYMYYIGGCWIPPSLFAIWLGNLIHDCSVAYAKWITATALHPKYVTAMIPHLFGILMFWAGKYIWDTGPELTPRWPLTPYMRDWPRYIVSKSHENTLKYVDTVTLACLDIHCWGLKYMDKSNMVDTALSDPPTPAMFDSKGSLCPSLSAKWWGYWVPIWNMCASPNMYVDTVINFCTVQQTY